VKYIFITGPARSGQTTITNKLNKHKGIYVYDEIPPCLPWDWDNHKRIDDLLEKVDKNLKRYDGHDIVGMAGLYYLKAIPALTKIYKEVYFHILKRPFKDVLQGYLDKIDNGKSRHDISMLSQKFFMHKDPMGENWEIPFPHYQKLEELNDLENYKLAIEKYYNEYHDIAKQYEKKYNNVKIWDSEYLIKNDNYLNLIQWQKK